MPGYTSPDKRWGAAKSEASQNTDVWGGAAPGAAEWFQCRNIDIDPVYESVRGPRKTATNAAEAAQRVRSHNAVVVEVPLMPKAGVDLGPAWDALLMACLFKRTIDAGVDVTYSDVTANNFTNCPTATVVKYIRSIEDETGKRLMARGCRFNFALTLELGQEPFFTFTGESLFDQVPDAFTALPTLPTAYSGDVRAMSVEQLSLVRDPDGAAIVYPVRRITYKSNLTIQRIMTGDSAGGGMTSKVLLMMQGEGPTFDGSLELIDGSAALADMLPAARNGTILALDSTVTNGSDTFKAEAPAVQLLKPTDNSPAYEVPFEVIRKPGTNGEGTLNLIWS